MHILRLNWETRIRALLLIWRKIRSTFFRPRLVVSNVWSLNVGSVRRPSKHPPSTPAQLSAGSRAISFDWEVRKLLLYRFFFAVFWRWDSYCWGQRHSPQSSPGQYQPSYGGVYFALIHGHSGQDGSLSSILAPSSWCPWITWACQL